jgi:hypothetical protein
MRIELWFTGGMESENFVPNEILARLELGWDGYSPLKVVRNKFVGCPVPVLIEAGLVDFEPHLPGAIKVFTGTTTCSHVSCNRTVVIIRPADPCKGDLATTLNIGGDWGTLVSARVASDAGVIDIGDGTVIRYLASDEGRWRGCVRVIEWVPCLIGFVVDSDCLDITMRIHQGGLGQEED